MEAINEANHLRAVVVLPLPLSVAVVDSGEFEKALNASYAGNMGEINISLLVLKTILTC